AILRRRLERRGIVPAVAAGLVAGVGAPLVAVPPGLIRRTVEGVFPFLSGRAASPAAVVAKGVVMGTAKVKAAGLVAAAAAGLIGIGDGGASDPLSPPGDRPLTPPPVSAPARPPEAPAAGLIPPTTIPAQPDA